MRFYALRLHEVGHDQVQPERDHRRGHRLALPQRAQARAEGVSNRAALAPTTNLIEEALMRIRQNRRDFLASASLAAAAGLLGARRPLAAEGPPETTTIRLAFTTAICFAPFDVAEAFLRAEGFTDVQYVRAAGGFSAPQMIAQRRGGLRRQLRRHRRLPSGCRPADHRGQLACTPAATSCSRASRSAASAT